MEGVNKELSRVESQHVQLTGVKTQVEDIINQIESCKAKFHSGNVTSRKEVLAPLLKSSKKHLESTKQEHKHFHTSLQKLSKAIDTCTESTANQLYLPWNMDKHILNEIIAEHLYREGLFDVADVFVSETNTSINSEAQAPFIEMYAVLQALRRRNLSPALEWAAQHSSELRAAGYSLEFHLHRLYYIELLRGLRDDGSPVEYARSHLGRFAQDHMDEIRRLMGAVLFQGRLESSPYSHLMNETVYSDVHDEFAQAACSLLGHATDSPLYVSVMAGSKALPTLFKLSKMLRHTPTDGSNTAEGQSQHAIDFELGPEFQFHSVFACPVSKEQATKDNPPVLLPCGHALGKNSMLALAKGPSQRFKCPYCPLECSAGECTPIYF